MSDKDTKTALAAAIESFPGYGITGPGMMPLATLIGGALAETDMALVPRDLLDELLEASGEAALYLDMTETTWPRVVAARAAVVEAVGPTREDQR